MYPRENLKNITLEIIDQCNLACRLCYTESGPAKFSMMDKRDVFAILEDAAETVDTITISGGEALLHPDIREICEYSVRHFEEVNLLSNAIDIDDETLAWLGQLRIRLGVSVDGREPMHDLQRGRGSFQKTAKTLLRARQASVPFWIQTVISGMDDDDLSYMVDLGKALGAYGVSFQRPKLIGRVNHRTTSWMSPRRYRAVVQKVHELQADNPAMTILIKDALHNCEDRDLKEGARHFEGTEIVGGCRAGLTYLYIRPNGDALMCPFVPNIVGNVISTGLFEVWDGSEDLERVRTKDNYTKCGSCENFRVCRGCRAEALAWTGDLMGEDPNCWQRPEHELDTVAVVGPSPGA